MIQRTFHTNIVAMVTARVEVWYGAVEAIIQSELQARARDGVDAAGALTKASGRRRGVEQGRRRGESGGRVVEEGGGEWRRRKGE